MNPCTYACQSPEHAISRRAFLGAITRTIEAAVVGMDAGPPKRFPARRQETANRRTDFEVARGHSFSFRRAAQTTRNAHILSSIVSRMHPIEQSMNKMSRALALVQAEGRRLISRRGLGGKWVDPAGATSAGGGALRVMSGPLLSQAAPRS